MAGVTNDLTRSPRTMEWAEVCARRLSRHGLSIPLDGGPADVRAALRGERRVVKTFGPRGTVHLLPARDLPLWTGALSAIPALPNPLPQGARLTPEQNDEVIAAIADALVDAELTVDELGEAVVDAVGGWAGDLVMPAFQVMWPHWRQAIAAAANRGALIFGSNGGRKTTFTSPRRWLTGFAPAPGEPAAAELVRRYLHAYGPATAHQFAQWLGAPRRWATALFDSLAGELRQVQTGVSTPAWLPAADTVCPARTPE